MNDLSSNRGFFLIPGFLKLIIPNDIIFNKVKHDFGGFVVLLALSGIHFYTSLFSY